VTAKPDPLIHPLSRLSICGVLAAGADWVEFATLRDAAGVTDSVLSKQSRVLEDAGYIEVRKGAIGRRPRTWFRLTRSGHQAVKGHLTWLAQLEQEFSTNAPVSIPGEGAPKARIVTALLRDGNRLLLCHRSPQRRWYPDVWDLPGGHVEPGERPGAALAREVREELGVDIAAPSGAPLQEVRADTFDMQIWLIEAWTGSPVNVAPEEHDAIGWFTEDALGDLSLAHDSYRAMFSRVLADEPASG
jgi:8-oxo-dGTP diphosphatase